MNKKVTIFCLAGVAAFLLADFAFVGFCKFRGGDWRALLSDGKPEEIEAIEIWQNGVNAKKPEYVFTSHDDIASFLQAIRASSGFMPNHPQYAQRFDIRIRRVDGKKHHASLRTGGSAGEYAVFYFSGGETRRSRELAILLAKKETKERLTKPSTATE